MAGGRCACDTDPGNIYRLQKLAELNKLSSAKPWSSMTNESRRKWNQRRFYDTDL